MFPWPLLPLALIFGVIYHTQFRGWSLLIFLNHTNKFASVKELAYFKHRGWGLEWWRDPCIVTSASPGRLSPGGRAAFFRKSSDLGVVLCSEHPVKLGVCICCSVAQSCPTLCDPWTAACQASLSITNYQSLLKLMFIESVMPSNHFILCLPFSSHLQSFPTSGSFQMSQFFTSGGQSIGVSASASVLPMTIQDWFPLGWTGGSPCSPRDSQESSPTPQFKSINSSALSFLYSPTLTSIHHYWKNHSLD